MRSSRKSRTLTPRDYTALWQLCGAKRRRGGFPPPAAEVQRLLHELTADGLVRPIDLPGHEPHPQERLVLAPQIEMRPALYQALDGQVRPLRLLGFYAALLLDGCDGARPVPSLAELAQAHGFRVVQGELANTLALLEQAQLIDATLPGGAPRRKPSVSLRPDAFLVRMPHADAAYLIGGEECDVLLQFREGATVGDLLAQNGPDDAWLRSVIARAHGLGMLVPVGAAAGAEDVAEVADDAGDDLDAATSLEFADERTVEASQLPDFRTAAAPQPPARPTPVPAPAAPPAPRASAPQIAAPPAVKATPRPFPAAAPPQVAPQPVFHEPPEEHTSPGAPAFGGRPAAPAPGDPVNDARLARLAALSLDKDNVSASISPTASAPRGASSKLPWILLAIFVIGGTTYHVITVRRLTAAADQAKPTDTAAGSATTAPTHSAASLLASGYIAAKAPIVLSATTSGRLDAVNVDNGASIKKGQVLAVVADGQVRAELSLANARIRDAQRALSRTKTLVRAQAATPLDLERAVGQVEIASAEARVIQQKLEDTKVKSPIDGTVLEVLAHPGESVTAGPNAAGILRIADLTSLIAEVNVNETELKGVSLGQPCEISAEAQREQTYKGVVREIAEQADRAKGTILVKVDIETTPETVLKPGMAVEVRFKPPGEKPAAAP